MFCWWRLKKGTHAYTRIKSFRWHFIFGEHGEGGKGARLNFRVSFMHYQYSWERLNKIFCEPKFFSMRSCVSVIWNNCGDHMFKCVLLSMIHFHADTFKSHTFGYWPSITSTVPRQSYHLSKIRSKQNELRKKGKFGSNITCQKHLFW